MSWFLYGRPKRRSLRKGVWLRVEELPPPLVAVVMDLARRLETIERCVVKEMRSWPLSNVVLLEFWMRRCEAGYPLNVWTVIQIEVQENPEWICEGDLGTGYRGECGE